MNSLSRCLVALHALIALSATAVPVGYPDPSFGVNGRVFVNFGWADFVFDMIIQPDDKILVLTCATQGPVNGTIFLARYGSDGKPDRTFGSGGRASILPGLPNLPRALALRPDGKILMVADYYTDSAVKAAVFRFNANGKLDSTFGIGGKVLLPIAALPGGKIMLAGMFNATQHSEAEALLCRLNEGGTIDTSFGVDGLVKTNLQTSSSDYWQSIALRPDGGFILGGSSFNSSYLVRVNAEGIFDAGFGVAGKAGMQQMIFGGMAVHADGRIMLAGSRGHGVALARFTAGGVLDVTFDGDGLATAKPAVEHSEGMDVVILPNDHYLVAGKFTETSADMSFAGTLVMKYRPAGSLDGSFGSRGFLLQNHLGDWEGASSIGLLGTGAPVVAGMRNFSRSRVDHPVFGTSSDVVIYRLETEDDGRMLVAQKPQSELLMPGEVASLSSSAIGEEPISYQWRKNGRLLPAMVTPYLNLGDSSAQNAGTYTLEINNPLGKLTTDPVVIAVVKPQPEAVVTTEGSRAVLRCNVSAPAGTRFLYGWLFNGSPIGNEPGYRGLNSPTLTIDRVTDQFLGTYSCRVFLLGPDRTIIRTAPAISLEYPVQPGLTDIAMADARVGEDVSFQIPRDGNPNHFTVVGLPPGTSYDPAAGVISGRPITSGVYKITITAANQLGSASTTMTWTVMPFNAWGEYHGLVGRSLDLRGNDGMGGTVMLTVTKSAMASGQLVMRGVSRRFVGPVTGISADSQVIPHVIVRVPAAGTMPALEILLSLTPDAAAGGESYVTDFVLFFAGVEMHRRQFHPTHAPASRHRGYYTFAISPPPNAPPDTPGGFGWLTARVAASGAVTWSGKLADNTTLTGGGFLGGAPVAHVPHPFLLHQLTYDGRGSVQGWISLAPDPGVDSWIVATGRLSWLTLPSTGLPPPPRNGWAVAPSASPLPAARTYAAGIVLHDRDVAGGEYRAPVPGTAPLDLQVVRPPVRNALVSAMGPGILGDITRLLTLGPANRIVIEPSDADTAVLVLASNPNSGSSLAVL